MTRIVFIAALGLVFGSHALAQGAPVGGPDARGNSPVKAAHTVNAGSAKPAANSFTLNQARRHIEHAGFANVTDLTKGRDGVWRGTGTMGGQAMSVALDFKGNVTHGAPSSVIQRSPAAPAALTAPDPVPSATSTPPNSDAGGPGGPARHGSRERRHRGHHHRHHGGGAVGRSGVDRNHNGLSDKEDRALAHRHE